MPESPPPAATPAALDELFAARLEPGPLRSSRLFALAIIGTLVLAALVGGSGLFSATPETHDIFPAQSAYEMYHRGSWLVPYFNDHPRLNKPPLGYWLTGAVAFVTGAHGEIMVWHARLGSLLSGLALVGATAFIGALLYGRLAAIVAGLLMGASLGFYDMAHSARPDMLYGAICAWQLAAILAACRAPDRSWAQWGWALSIWLLAALATLAKGPQVPLLLLMAILVWLLVRRVPLGRIWRILRPATGIALFILVGAPWFLYIAHLMKTGALPYSVELGTNEISGSDLGVNWLAPLGASFYYYYEYQLVRMLLPWIVFVPGLVAIAFVRGPMRTSARLLGWILIAAVIMFGFGATRRLHYLLPVLPAAVAMAVASIAWFDWSRRERSDIWPALIIAYAIAGLGVIVWTNIYEHLHGGVHIEWTDIAGVVGVLAVAAAYFVIRRRGAAAWPISCRAGALLLPLLFVPVFAAGGGHPALSSPRDRVDYEFARDAADLADDDTDLVAFSCAAENLVYLRRRPVPEAYGIDALATLVDESTHPHVFVVTRAEFVDSIPESWNPQVILHQPEWLGDRRFFVLEVSPDVVRAAAR